MVSNFYRDLKQAQKAEALVQRTMQKYFPSYCFKLVSDNPAYYHRGDILFIGVNDGKEHCIEVKNDSRIAQTRNVLCEEQVFYMENRQMIKGNMYSDYELYAVVSEQERNIYLLDFAVMKQLYKDGCRYTQIPHEEQITYCYLLPLRKLETAGGIIEILEF